MSVKRLVGFLLMALAMATVFSTVALAENGAITVTKPDGNQIISETNDFAATKYLDSWNFSNDEDKPLLTKNFKNINQSNGTWSATAINSDAQFNFIFAGFPGSYPVGREGTAMPVNCGIYKRLIFRMNSSLSGKCQLYCFRDNTHKNYEVKTFPTQTGWHTYVVDIPWSGMFPGLRIDPVDKSGAVIQFDWIKLTPPAIDSQSLTVEWDDEEGGNVDLLLSRNNLDDDGELIKTNISSEKGHNTYAFDTALLDPGDYYVYARRGVTNYYSLGTFKINKRPIIKITDPDYSGGADWAKTTLHNEWNFNSSSDMSRWGGLTGLSLSGGLLSAISYNNNNYIYLRQAGHTINTDVYRFLTFKYCYSGSFDLGRGTMSRVIWKSNGRTSISDDIITYTGWRTYTIDLKKLALEKGSYGWRGRASAFRFDPNEDHQRRHFHLDYVKLAAEDKLSSHFHIKYNYTDDDPSATLDLYWDKDRTFGNGNEGSIKKGLKIANGNGSYSWSPSKGFKKRVYIYARVNDGFNEPVGSYSTGALRVHI